MSEVEVSVSMTQLEQSAARALYNVRTGVFNNAGRFIGWLEFLAEQEPSRELKPHQLKGLWELVWRYRRQIADRDLVALAQYGGDVAACSAAQSTQRSMFV